MGTILAGVTTPTEAAALGAVGSLVLALANRMLTWEVIVQSLGVHLAHHLHDYVAVRRLANCLAWCFSASAEATWWPICCSAWMSVPMLSWQS